MSEAVATLLESHFDEIFQIVDRRLLEMDQTFYGRLPEQQRQQAGSAAIRAVISDLREPGSIDATFGQIALQRARTPNYDIRSFKPAFYMLRNALMELVPTWLEDQQQVNTALDQIDAAVLRGTAAFYETYINERESALAEREAEMQMISEEQDKLTSMLRELSSPIVPVHDSILVLPLVGAIDTSRAQTITEDLLEAIVRRQADIVIIDITGVPVVDTAIANYLLQTTKAVNLLGAQVILVGISAEVAQTIVGLDLDLAQLTVRANLQDGIAYALRLLGLQIEERDAAR